MCGIAGIVADLDPAAVAEACRRMARAQAHRGPDDEGVICQPACGVTVGLASRRLAVLDPTPAGHQPMASDDGLVWVAYNGELYNFPSLREELESRGCRFRSRTDTEVVLRAYEAFGTDCVRRFRGMFALAVWDGRAGQLMLARDRLGEKPLYVDWDGRTFLFASEVRALLASGLVERRLEPAALEGYLAFGAVPAPMTMIEGVRLLGPGTVLTWRDGVIREHRYWSPEFTEDRGMHEAAAAEELLARLREAVRIRLLSDVPLGAFLSGGVDSSAVVAMMREAGAGRIRTFSVGFEEAAYDETPQARLIAKRFETEHTETRLTSQDVLTGLDPALEAMDQPTVDGLNTYFVSQAARASGTVVALSGLGGDELFGGYSTFTWVPALMRWSRWLGAVPGARRGAVGLLGVFQDGRAEKLRAFLERPPTPEGAYAAAKGLYVNGAVRRLLAEPPVGFDAPSYLRRLLPGEAEPVFNRVSRMELTAYLHHQLLRDADMMSMAHALELRPPFLDHELVEFAGRVPVALKMGPPKRLLIRALGGRLPAEILTQRKRGFSFPLELWLRGPWKATTEARLLDQAGAGIFRQAALEDVWRQFLAGRVRWARVWALIVAQAWITRHVHGTGHEATTDLAASVA